jgi:hypothetical protein
MIFPFTLTIDANRSRGLDCNKMAFKGDFYSSFIKNINHVKIGRIIEIKLISSQIVMNSNPHVENHVIN